MKQFHNYRRKQFSQPYSEFKKRGQFGFLVSLLPIWGHRFAPLSMRHFLAIFKDFGHIGLQSGSSTYPPQFCGKVDSFWSLSHWIQSTTNCTLVLVRNCRANFIRSFPRNSIVRLKTKGGGKGGDKVSAMSFPAPRGNGE